MINRRFEEVSEADIASLIENRIQESRTLEYKAQLPSNSADEKREFFADITSMANAMGGDLIYGIPDARDGGGRSTGTPTLGVGLVGNADEEILRLENMCRDNIDPRIIGLQMKAVQGFKQGYVIVVRVPRSLSAPHMVATGSSRFYSRNSTGKYPLDVMELRAAFAASEAFADRIHLGVGRGARIHFQHPPVVDRNNLLLPEIMIAEPGLRSDHVLRPAFDILWQAAGYKACADYDEAGNWRRST